MQLEQFVSMIEQDPELKLKKCSRCDKKDCDLITSDGYEVESSRWGTRTHFTEEAILNNTEPILLSAMMRGRDVDHITRITGYFSKVSGWNNGKKAELFDRHRSIEEEWST